MKVVRVLQNRPILQQNLKRCRLRSVPFCTSAIFFVLGVFYTWLFCFYGVTLHDSVQNNQIDIRYDDKCGNQSTCIISFTINESIDQPVGIYYKITNLKQMRREIASSYNPLMLRGQYVDKSNLDNCKPNIYFDNTENDTNLLIPCGTLPSIVFTDTFSIIDNDLFSDSEDLIILDVDREDNYHEPASQYNISNHWLLGTGLFKKAQKDPHFIIWMRQSAFSPFRKLYSVSKTGIPKGSYNMSIRNNYNTNLFHGEKHFVIAEIGHFGTLKNGEMIVFGLMAILFLIAAALLGIIGYNRTKPKSKFHPNQLKTVFIQP